MICYFRCEIDKQEEGKKGMTQKGEKGRLVFSLKHLICFLSFSLCPVGRQHNPLFYVKIIDHFHFLIFPCGTTFDFSRGRGRSAVVAGEMSTNLTLGTRKL